MPEYILKGFVGALPEIKSVGSAKVAEFIVSLPCGTADKERKIWVKCIAWGDLAQKVKEHVSAGSLVGICGRIWDVRAYSDKKGKPQASLEIRADKIFKGPSVGKLVDISFNDTDKA